MKRYKWLRAEWPLSIRTLAKRLKSRPFDADNTTGFVIDRVRDDCLEARFIERLEYDESVTDPFGLETSYHRIDFRQCVFRATSEKPGLELIDSPRSLQTMVSSLLDACSFDLTINPITINVLDWATQLRTMLDTELLVESIQIGALHMQKGISAKLILKGDRDVKDAALEAINGRVHTIEKLQLKLLGRQRGTILLINSGAIKIESEKADDLLSAVRTSLAKTII
jgi:hypothetical protein